MTQYFDRDDLDSSMLRNKLNEQTKDIDLLREEQEERRHREELQKMKERFKINDEEIEKELLKEGI